MDDAGDDEQDRKRRDAFASHRKGTARLFPDVILWRDPAFTGVYGLCDCNQTQLHCPLGKCGSQTLCSRAEIEAGRRRAFGGG